MASSRSRANRHATSWAMEARVRLGCSSSQSRIELAHQVADRVRSTPKEPRNAGSCSVAEVPQAAPANQAMLPRQRRRRMRSSLTNRSKGSKASKLRTVELDAPSGARASGESSACVAHAPNGPEVPFRWDARARPARISACVYAADTAVRSTQPGELWRHANFNVLGPMVVRLRCALHVLLRVMKCLAIANQKGGVGKTTTAVHLAHGLALAGKAVVLVDLDPQGNATVALQGTGRSQVCGLGRELGDHFWLPSIDLVPPSQVGAVGAFLARHEVQSTVDWVVVDCPPRLDPAAWSALQVADGLLVPVQAEFLAMHGLSQMLATLQGVSVGSSKLRGVLPTMVDASQPISVEIVEDLRKNLGPLLLTSVVLRDLGVVEAASHGKTVFDHCPWSSSALCYAELTKEILHG
jgi:chromosome partitioning protein